MSGPIPVRMPTGQVIYLEPNDDYGMSPMPRDVSLGQDIVEVLQVPGVIETIDGVLSTVRLAVAKARPDKVAVEFGVELNAKTGRVLSVLAEAGGKAHVKVTATWERPTNDEPAEVPPPGRPS